MTGRPGPGPPPAGGYGSGSGTGGGGYQGRGPPRGGFRGRYPPPRGSTRRVQMLNIRRGEYFRIDLREILRSGTLPETTITSLGAAIFAKAARQSIEVAKEFVEEKGTEGLLPPEMKDKVLALLDKFSFWR